MDAYAVAGEILGDLALSPGQVAQLRAIDHEHQQRLCALVHGGREPSAAERAELRALLASAVRGILTPEQRAALERG